MHADEPGRPGDENRVAQARPLPARGSGRELAAGRPRARPFGAAARLVQQATAIAKTFPASLGFL
jgi:hypothetical protein